MSAHCKSIKAEVGKEGTVEERRHLAFDQPSHCAEQSVLQASTPRPAIWPQRDALVVCHILRLQQ